MKSILICSEKYRKRKELSIWEIERHLGDEPILVESVFLNKQESDAIKKEFNSSAKLGRGSIGCYLAHENAIKVGLELSENFLVFEDDIKIVHENFISLINDLEIIMIEDDVAIIFFSNYGHKEKCGLIKNPKRFTNAQGYMVNIKYSRVIFDFIKKERKVAIDRCYHQIISLLGHKVYHTSQIVHQNGDKSIIKEIGR